MNGTWSFVVPSCVVSACGTTITSHLSEPENMGSRHLVMVYVGSSTCGPSNGDELLTAVAKLREELARAADERSLGYRTIGVAIDHSTEQGYEHLERVGRFDEIITGSRWTNLGALRYIWQTLPGQASTPQVIATMREWSGDPDEPLTDRSVTDETLLLRLVGSREIQQWAEDSARLPVLPTGLAETPD